MRNNSLNYSHMNSIVSYDAETGVLTWRSRQDRTDGWNRLFAGKSAGCIDGTGYIKISLGRGRGAMGHRVAWLLATGNDAIGDIDHINGNKADNRLVNLRVASRSENMRNRPAPRSNTSGFKGVAWHRDAGRWLASIKVHRRAIYLGLFDTPEAAHAAYIAGSAKHHGEFARTA